MTRMRRKKWIGATRNIGGGDSIVVVVVQNHDHDPAVE